MKQIGTFWQGFAVVLLSLAAAVLSEILKIAWLMTIAPVLFAIGLTYIGGGAAGKAEAVFKLTRAGVIHEREQVAIRKILRS